MSRASFIHCIHIKGASVVTQERVGLKQMTDVIFASKPRPWDIFFKFVIGLGGLE